MSEDLIIDHSPRLEAFIEEQARKLPGSTPDPELDAYIDQRLEEANRLLPDNNKMF